ncbi:MAG: tetratricopeptide repeat protein [Pseudomonadota bacterium]
MSSLSSRFDDFWTEVDDSHDPAEVIVPLPEMPQVGTGKRTSSSGSVAPQAHLRWVVFPAWGLLLLVTLGMVTWHVLQVPPLVATHHVGNPATPVAAETQQPGSIPAPADVPAQQRLAIPSFWLLVEPRFTSLHTTRQPSAVPAAIAAMQPEESTAPPAVPPERTAPPEVEPGVSQASFARIPISLQESRLLERVRGRLFAGEKEKAIGELKQFVSENGPREQVIRVLAGLLVQSGRFHEANRHLATVTSSSDPELRFLKARVLVHLGDSGAALVLLREQLPPVEAQPAYHALLAALYQRAGLPSDAVLAYRLLVQLSPENADWLLGLAISQEQLGKVEPAAHSYRQLLALGTLAADVRHFAEARLRVLGTR